MDAQNRIYQINRELDDLFHQMETVLRRGRWTAGQKNPDKDEYYGLSFQTHELLNEQMRLIQEILSADEAENGEGVIPEE